MKRYFLIHLNPINYRGKGAWIYREGMGVPVFIDSAPYTTPTYVQ